MSEMCVNKANRTARAFSTYLDTGVIAMPQGEIAALQNSLRDFSYTGIDQFETYLTPDILMVIKLFNKASRMKCAGSWEGKCVSSISEALQAIGVEQLQEMLEVVSNKRVDQDQRQQKIISESAHEAFVTGVFTKTLATKLGTDNNNDLMLAGQMQQLGRVLACASFPFEFERMSNQTRGFESKENEKRYFGTSLLDITNQLLQDSSLPAGVLKYLENANQQEKKNGPCDEESSLLMVARSTTNLLCSSDLSWSEFEGGISHLLPKLSKNFQISRKDFLHSLGDTFDCLRDFQSKNNSLDDPGVEESIKYPITQRLNILANERRIVFPPLQRSLEIPMSRICSGGNNSGIQYFGNNEQSDLTDDISVSNKENSKPKGKGGPTGLAAASQVFSILKDFHSTTKNSLAEFVAWSHLKALKLKNCLVMIPNDSQDELSLAYSEGSWFVEEMSDIVIDLEEKSIFNACLDTRKDIILKAPTPKKLKPFIPEWLEEKTNDYHCAILPAFSQDQLQALLICLGTESTFYQGNSKILKDSKNLRADFAKAIKLKSRRRFL